MFQFSAEEPVEANGTTTAIVNLASPQAHFKLSEAVGDGNICVRFK